MTGGGGVAPEPQGNAELVIDAACRAWFGDNWTKYFSDELITKWRGDMARAITVAGAALSPEDRRRAADLMAIAVWHHSYTGTLRDSEVALEGLLSEFVIVRRPGG